MSQGESRIYRLQASQEAARRGLSITEFSCFHCAVKELQGHSFLDKARYALSEAIAQFIVKEH